jgi:Endonuclease NucS
MKMLEHDMELAVAACPDLFIEAGLSLVQRQVVIGGRRPDILFSDSLSRHLLVELQRGRLDEAHLQRHVYYFIDYRAKYPAAHPRLMFIANRVTPQHKEFLDDHGYEFREYPENDFLRRIGECGLRRGTAAELEMVPVETPGVLPPSVSEILFEIEMQKMTLSYKMLLLLYMAELADESGRVPLRQLAEKFQDFFVQRAAAHKQEENPNLVAPGTLSGRTLTAWERTIREEPVRRITERFVLDEGTTIRWAPRIWSQWSPQLKQEISNAAFDRLVRYFVRHVPGGY